MQVFTGLQFKVVQASRGLSAIAELLVCLTSHVFQSYCMLAAVTQSRCLVFMKAGLQAGCLCEPANSFKALKDMKPSAEIITSASLIIGSFC